MEYPIEWLEVLPAETLAFWRAFNRVEPIGRDWERSAGVAASIDKIYQILLTNLGGTPTKKDQADYMPPDWYSENWTADTKQTIGQQLQCVSKTIGK